MAKKPQPQDGPETPAEEESAEPQTEPQTEPQIEELIAEKVRAGLTREQAIEVLESQAREDANSAAQP